MKYSVPNTFRAHCEELEDGKVLLYSEKPNDSKLEFGVRLLLTASAWCALSTWKPVSDILLTAKLWSKLGSIIIVQCCAPTETFDIVEGPGGLT